MSTGLMIEIVKILGYIVLGGLALYLNTKGSLKEKAASFIAEAEEAYKDASNAGGAKFEYVVDKLYALVPTALKLVIPRAMISDLVQKAFDAAEAYAKTQLDKAVARMEATAETETETETESTVESTAETTAEAQTTEEK